MEVNLNSPSGIPNETYNFIKNITINPVVMIIIGIVLVLYYFLFASLGIVNNQDNNKNILFLEMLLWIIFIILLLLNGIYYFFNINIVATIKDIFSEKTEIKLAIDSDTSNTSEKNNNFNFLKQVFHIPGNNYTYEDSKAICKAFDSKLANYKEMEKAYEQGADWCSYGWSEGQMAYFPTQHEKWEKMQKIKGHENDCGRPGINGGFIQDENIKFGVNCYGYRPKMNSKDYQIMYNTPLYPKTQKEIDFDIKVNYFKNKLPNIGIAPFNNNSWSII